MHKVFPDAPAYFGKLLYLYMANGYDRVKISLLQYYQCFQMLLVPGLSTQHNKVAFEILDLDRDKQLNILNLVHL